MTQDNEVEEMLVSMGGDWAVVGEYDELVNIIDNNVFKKFEALAWIIEDDALYSATNAYLLKQNLTRFATHDELDNYLATLTAEKYGNI